MGHTRQGRVTFYLSRGCSNTPALYVCNAMIVSIKFVDGDPESKFGNLRPIIDHIRKGREVEPITDDAWEYVCRGARQDNKLDVGITPEEFEYLQEQMANSIDFHAIELVCKEKNYQAPGSLCIQLNYGRQKP